MENVRLLTPAVDLCKINLLCMLLQIKRKIKQQPDTKSAVEIMFQHMVDHVKHVFRRRKYMVRRSVDFLCFCFQIFSGKDFIDQLVRRFILIYSNHTVMQLQKKAASCLFKRIAISGVMIRKFFFIQIAVFMQNLFCTVKRIFIINIEIQIAEFAIFRNRIRGSKADPLHNKAGNAMLFQKRYRATCELIDLIVIQHHVLTLLKYLRIKTGIPEIRKHKRKRTVTVCKCKKCRIIFR